MQIKNNFRDPAVQHFGGKKFHEFADIADDIYNSMPTPTPSRKSQEARAAQQQDDDDMDYLNNQCCGGGCFTGDSLIKMANGSSK